MRRSFLMLACAALPVVMLEGCATWGPTWSEITGQRYNVTITNRRPAIIDRVDDRGSFPNPNMIRVEPGLRRLVVHGPAPGRAGGPPLHVMMLDVEPCERYYINAQFTSPIQREWTPVIDFVEPISGCQMPAAK